MTGIAAPAGGPHEETPYLMQTKTPVDEMRDYCTTLGESWLRDHPVMEPPAGFALDPLAIRITRETDCRSGWFLSDAEWEVQAMFMDLGPAARALVHDHVERVADIVRIELWDGVACIWAAARIPEEAATA